MNLTKKIGVVVALTFAFAFSQNAGAQLVIDLTGTPGSSDINIALSGTITETDNNDSMTGFGVFTSEFSTGDFTTFFLGTTPITGTTTVTNLNSGTSTPVDGLLSTDRDRLSLIPDSIIFTSLGDVLSFSGSATFTLPNGRTFDELNTGAYSGDFTFGPIVGNGVTLNITSLVPEPSALVLFGLGLIGLGTRRRSAAC